MNIKYTALVLAAFLSVSANAADSTDPMVGCYTLAVGNFDIEVKKADGKYTADFSKQGGEKKVVALEALAGDGLAGIVPAAERDQVEKALAGVTAEDIFFIAKYKAGVKPESDYMATASMALGGGPAMKVDCK